MKDCTHGQKCTSRNGALLQYPCLSECYKYVMNAFLLAFHPSMTFCCTPNTPQIPIQLVLLSHTTESS